MSELPEILEALVVRPGDTLILRYSRPVTQTIVNLLRERVRHYLPDVADVIVIDNCEQLAVFRPDPETKPIDIIPLEAKRKP